MIFLRIKNDNEQYNRLSKKNFAESATSHKNVIKSLNQFNDL